LIDILNMGLLILISPQIPALIKLLHGLKE